MEDLEQNPDDSESEDGQFDEAQFAAWVKQASELPGERS